MTTLRVFFHCSLSMNSRLINYTALKLLMYVRRIDLQRLLRLTSLYPLKGVSLLHVARCMHVQLR